MNNLVNLGNHISNYTVNSAIAGAVGYGLTRTFTTLNPVAGATFFGAFILAGAVINPVFVSTINKTSTLTITDSSIGLKKTNPINNSKLNTSAFVVGNTIKFALAYFANTKLTSLIHVISNEIMSTTSLIKDSISLPDRDLVIQTISAGILKTKSLFKSSISQLSLPKLSLRNVGGSLLFTVLVLGILSKLTNGSRKDRD